jgi:hypothetical protein
MINSIIGHPRRSVRPWSAPRNQKKRLIAATESWIVLAGIMKQMQASMIEPQERSS